MRWKSADIFLAHCFAIYCLLWRVWPSVAPQRFPDDVAIRLSDDNPFKP